MLGAHSVDQFEQRIEAGVEEGFLTKLHRRPKLNHGADQLNDSLRFDVDFFAHLFTFFFWAAISPISRSKTKHQE